jgi:GNAT superfamily N-acetyltransferase
MPDIRFEFLAVAPDGSEVGGYVSVYVDGTPAGGCGFAEVSPGIARPLELYVAPPHRSRDVEELLLDAVTDEAERMGLRIG